MKDWINNEIPSIADSLEEQILSTYHIETDEGLNLAGREAINTILDDILATFFPGAYSKSNVDSNDLNYYIGSQLRKICHELTKHMLDVLNFHCEKLDSSCDSCSCEERAKSASEELIRSLPEIRNMLISDITSAYQGDPASKSFHEVILSYPFIEAIATQRVAHKLYQLNIPVIPRIMTERAHSNTGIDIHPGAKIGKGFFIDHGTGVVIGETSVIGDNVTIYHGVTLGAFSPFDRIENKYRGKKRHPDIEDGVIIYSGAVILGGETVIGANSVIGGSSWITKSIAPNSMVYSKFDTVVKDVDEK